MPMIEDDMTDTRGSYVNSAAVQATKEAEHREKVDELRSCIAASRHQLQAAEDGRAAAKVCFEATLRSHTDGGDAGTLAWAKAAHLLTASAAGLNPGLSVLPVEHQIGGESVS